MDKLKISGDFEKNVVGSGRGSEQQRRAERATRVEADISTGKCIQGLFVSQTSFLPSTKPNDIDGLRLQVRVHGLLVTLPSRPRLLPPSKRNIETIG